MKLRARDLSFATELGNGDGVAWTLLAAMCRLALQHSGVGARIRPDLEQELLLNLWAHRVALFRAFRGNSSLSAFLHPRIVWTLCRTIERLRRDQRHLLFVDPEWLDLHLATDCPATAAPAEETRTAGGRGDIEAIVGALPDSQATILRMVAGGSSWSEVAYAAGISRDAARKRFARALRTLSQAPAAHDAAKKKQKLSGRPSSPPS